MYNYTFKAGIRFVTVEAYNADEARAKAKVRIEERAREEDLEPNHDPLYLIRIES